MAIIVPDRRVWTSQPQVSASVNADYDTVVVPEGKFLRTLVGSNFANFGDFYLSAGVEKFGRVAKNSLSNYFYRARPWALSGPRTWAAVLKCDTASVTQGIWSVASSDVSGTPYFLLQRNGTDVRLYAPGSGYIITFAGVATTGAILNIAFGCSNLTSGGSGTAYLAINGVIQSASYTGGTNAATNEYLLSGYNGQLLGGIGGFASIPRFNREEIRLLSENPFGQIFRPQDDFIFVDTGGGGAVTGNLAATESADTFAVAGIVLVQGALTSTETSSDTFAGTGDASAEIIGNLSSTESGTDALAVVGSVKISGSFASTESGIDTFAGTGDASDIVFGNLNATEDADGFAAIGSVDVIGSLAGMEVGADSILINGNSVRTGYLDAIESGVDSFAATQPSVLTLTPADLAAIAAIVQGIVDAGVNVTKLNGATLYGSGISSDKWRGTA